jgi:hypothetical protein
MLAIARTLVRAGWQVQITDEYGKIFQPNRFEELLRFDRSLRSGFELPRCFGLASQSLRL